MWWLKDLAIMVNPNLFVTRCGRCYTVLQGETVKLLRALATNILLYAVAAVMFLAIMWLVVFYFLHPYWYWGY